jgi:hypothetical protein
MANLTEQSRMDAASQEPKLTWTDIQLRLATKNEFVSLEILRYLYITPSEPALLMVLVARFRRQRICSDRRTIWNRCLKLEEMGLIQILHGNPISIWPARQINPDNINLLVRRCYKSLLGDFYGD